MRKTKTVILGLFITSMFLSCVGIEPEYISPQGKKYVPADTLELMLYDINVIDAVITTRVVKLHEDDPARDTLLYQNVFDKYNYSREEFDETLLYYTQNNLDSLNRIYDKVLERLNTEKAINQ